MSANGQQQQQQQQQQNGVLKVLTFTGTQPFVVRCERDTRVKDIVGAIAEIWGFKEAARLFTLCHPAAGSDLSDPIMLLPGTVLSWTDRPCQLVPPATGTEASQDATAAAAAAAASGTQPPPPLLLVRYIFGSTATEWDQNHSVLSLTAAQIAADVAAARYPGVPEAGLYQHWVKQGQHSVVLHMAASWPSGACLIVGPAQVLSGGAGVQLGSGPFNLGLNSKGLHIMVPQQHRLLLPLDTIKSATPTGDVLNISFVSGQPDLLLQLPGADAVAEAFRVHKDAAGPQVSTAPPLQEGDAGSAAAAPGSGPASGKRGGPQLPLWITSPSVERWLQEPTPKDDAPRVSVSLQVLRPWEQTPPVLRVLLTTEQPKPDDRLVQAQLLVVDDDEDDDSSAAEAGDAAPEAAGADAPEGTAAAQDAGTAAQDAPKRQRQQRIKLQLKVLEQPAVPPEPRVKLTIAPVPQAEQELLTPAPGEEPLVRLVIKTHEQRAGAGSTSPLNVLRMLHKGAAAGLQSPGAGPPGVPPGIAGSSDGVMLRGMQLGGAGGAGAGGAAGDAGDERPHPQLMQRLQQQQQQQQEVRQGLLAGSHLGQAGFSSGPGMRPAYGAARPAYGSGYRPSMGMQQQQQGASWGQQQQYGSGMMARPAGMRPMGASGVPHQPYALAGPPSNMVAQQQQQQQQQQMMMQQRQGMAAGSMGGGMHSMTGRVMRPQLQQQQQQQYAQYQQQQQQQQYAQMRQQQQAQQQQQQQVVMQQGGYMLVQQQPQAQMQPAMLQQQQPQVAYAAMPQQQQQPQQVMMLQANANTAAGVSNNMVLVTTADGRQLLVHESQLQQQQQQQLAVHQLQQAQQQAAVMPGVFVLGTHGELVPASQSTTNHDPNAGMQQVVLQQQQPQQQQQTMMMAQAQGQPMFVQPTPSQKLQQQFPGQAYQQVQYQQPQQQQQRQVAGMAGLGAGGQYDQLSMMGMAQPQQQVMQQQGQPMGMMNSDMNAAQLQLQAQQQQQQQQQQQHFIAVSNAQVSGQAAQLLQLQGMQGIAGTSAAMGAGQQSFVLQGQQQHSFQQQQQQQLLVANAGGQQQQQVVVPGGAGLVDGSNLGLLQQQIPRRSNGTATGNMVVTSGAMFGQQPVAPGSGLLGSSGPGSSSGGGMAGLGLLQQGMAGGNAPGLGGAGLGGQGLMGMPGSAAPGLAGMSLTDNSLANTSMGMGGLGSVGGMGGVGAPGSSYLNSFDPLRQPNSHSSLDNTGLGAIGTGAAAQTADPPGLNYGAGGAQKPGGFLQQQQQPQPQQQQQQQQMFALGNAGMGGMGVQDGLQGGVLTSDGYMLAHDGMALTGAAPGLDAATFGAAQQFGNPTQQFGNPCGFY